MAGKLKQKLGAQSGETLLESLVAILVIIFSGLTLYFSVITAARVNHAAALADEAFGQELRAAEMQESGMAGTIHIDAGGGEEPIEIEVYYTGKGDELSSYKLR